MPRKTVSNAWQKLNTKVKEFEEFASCPVVCLAFVKNAYVFVDSDNLIKSFAMNDSVTALFKTALALQALPFENNAESEGQDQDLVDIGLLEALQCHAFDMNVAMIRGIINALMMPKDALNSLIFV